MYLRGFCRELYKFDYLLCYLKNWGLTVHFETKGLLEKGRLAHRNVAK